MKTTTDVRMPEFRVLGVRVHAVQIPQVVDWMEYCIHDRGRARYVAVTGMHGVTESHQNPEFRSVLRDADLVVPDGMPLVWLGRLRGFSHLARRVYGPELMETFCRETGAKYRHFFYGGAPGIADRLAQVEQERHGIRVAGTYCPPFRPLTAEEDKAVIAMINEAAPDVVWVGLSTPKQEKWMHEHRNRLQVPLLLGVGAAFDLNSGQLKQAPAWMREHGLEWLFRLMAEPKRLWRRYLVQGSRFVWNVLLELTALRIYE
jgi:N-acetylglucosaminyldiphosphoundecaprenol N-acetyl-beta-D-mannosaminyltransferase